MKWLLCYQTPYDTVKYISDIQEVYTVLSYKDFITFITKFELQDYKDFLHTLDRFYTIYIDLEAKEWVLYRSEKKEASFEELKDINDKRQKENMSKTEKGKEFIKSFIDKKKDNYLIKKVDDKKFKDLHK